jgi:FtsH-binding integral membrane protein
MTTKTIKTSHKPQALTFESFISRTYGYMFGGMLTTALVAFLTIFSGFIESFFTLSGNVWSLNLLGYAALYAPFAMLLFLHFKRIETFSVNNARAIFFSISILLGFMMSLIVLQVQDIGLVMGSLLGTSAIFAGSALVGHYIKHDLSFVGRIAYMAFWGIIIVSIFAAIFSISLNSVLMSYVVIVLASVLIAYEHQSLKIIHSYLQHRSDESEKIAILGALSLYVNFINIFINLLNLANRK